MSWCVHQTSVRNFRHLNQQVFTNCHCMVSHPTSGQTEQTHNTIDICRSNKTKNRYMTHSCLQQQTLGILTASAGSVMSNDTDTLHVQARIGVPTWQPHFGHCAPSLTLGSTARHGTGHHDRPHWVGLLGRMIGPTQRPVPDNTQHIQ